MAVEAMLIISTKGIGEPDDMTISLTYQSNVCALELLCTKDVTIPYKMQG